MTASFSYPNIVLWNKGPLAEKSLRIINEQDFPMKELLGGLGIERSPLVPSFGTTDTHEIRSRQDLFRFLAQNPRLCKEIEGISHQPIPTEGAEWLEYYDQEHNPHWQNVLRVMDGLEKKKGVLPSRLLSFLAALQEKAGEETAEKELGQAIAKELSKVTLIEGVATYRWDSSSNELDDDLGDEFFHVHGYRSFSSSLARFKMPSQRSWRKLDLLTLCLGWLKHKAWYLRKVWKKNSILRNMAISNLPDYYKSVLITVANRFLKQINLRDMLKVLLDDKDAEARVTLHFTYGKEGLTMRIVSVEPIAIGGDCIYFRHDGFEGFSTKQQREIQQAMVKVQDALGNTKEKALESEMRSLILKADKTFFEERAVPSPEFDLYYRWFAVEEALSSPAFMDQAARASAHRNFFYGQMDVLREVVFLVKRMKEAAKSRNASFCYGEFNEEGQGVQMEGVLPMHLAAKEVPVPISGIEKINGFPVGFLGKNGGGKSTAELTLAVDIYLTQSGLPVLGVKGARFAITPMKTLSLIFVERAVTGSTCEKLLAKMEKTLEHLERSSGCGTTVIADEIGSGTDPDEVLELAQNFLVKVAKSGASFVFSTQIRGLAQFAENSLGAKCYQFGRDHQIQPGIGNPDPVGLARERGFTRLLSRE